MQVKQAPEARVLRNAEQKEYNACMGWDGMGCLDCDGME